jgi:hypothetical protein
MLALEKGSQVAVRVLVFVFMPRKVGAKVTAGG